DLATRKRSDLRPTHSQGSDRTSVFFHRYGHDAAVRPGLCNIAQRVICVGVHIGKFFYRIGENCPTRCNAPTWRGREPAKREPASLRPRPMRRREVDELTIEPKHVAELGMTELHRVFGNHVEHRLDIGRRAGNDTQYVADRSLVIE